MRGRHWDQLCAMTIIIESKKDLRVEVFRTISQMCD